MSMEGEPPNGRYATFREFADFREEVRMSIQRMDDEYRRSLADIRTDLGTGLRTLATVGDQVNRMIQEQHDDRTERQEQARTRWAAGFDLKTAILSTVLLIVGGGLWTVGQHALSRLVGG